MSTPANPLLGHELYGSGPSRVLLTNDWLSDTSTWDAARAYLDTERFTFAFVDLRGYGRSRGRTGDFTLNEAVNDVLGLADALGWSRFAVVGHSMSSLVALRLAQLHAERIERVALLAPPPPRGFGADDAALAAYRGLALADDTTRLAVLEQRFGQRLSTRWASFKAARWRSTADPVAAAGYVAMFARDGLGDPGVRIAAPVFAITGEHDAPPMRGDAIRSALGEFCEQLLVTPLADSGHYPMQELPPLTVALLERFLRGEP
jgi:3-oxoadipate enol-lactonase